MDGSSWAAVANGVAVTVEGTSWCYGPVNAVHGVNSSEDWDGWTRIYCPAHDLVCDSSSRSGWVDGA